MEWISVKDRLPDKEGKYLCVDCSQMVGKPFIRILSFSNDLHEIDEYDFCSDKGKSGFYGYDGEWGYYSAENITHWMPLPELPKGE